MALKEVQSTLLSSISPPFVIQLLPLTQSIPTEALWTLASLAEVELTTRIPKGVTFTKRISSTSYTAIRYASTSRTRTFNPSDNHQ